MCFKRYFRFVKKMYNQFLVTERVSTNFYSPIPNLKEIPNNVWSRKSNLHGIIFDEDAHFNFLKEIAPYYKSADFKLSEGDATVIDDFYILNPSFSFYCAAVLHSMILYAKPLNIIEVGSGQSSKVINAAISILKSKDPELIVNYTVIDPYVSEIVSNMSNVTMVVNKKVQELPDDYFNDKLGENDILFIDSSHAVKLNSDVNYLILDVLPQLKSGVYVHFHDIGLPYEYPKKYYTSKIFRMYWTEAYLLQAFLINNNDFEIILPIGNLLVNRGEEVNKLFPYRDARAYERKSGSFWIKSI